MPFFTATAKPFALYQKISETMKRKMPKNEKWMDTHLLETFEKDV
jgi:hypothetical protein